MSALSLLSLRGSECLPCSSGRWSDTVEVGLEYQGLFFNDHDIVPMNPFAQFDMQDDNTDEPVCSQVA